MIVTTIKQSTCLAAIYIALSLSAAQAQIKVGLVLPLSGPLANTGKDIATGTRLYVESINATTGIASGPLKGQKIELIIEDDQFDPAQSEALARKLVKEHNVTALLSCFGTVNCIAVAKVAQETNTPLLGPIAGAESLRKPTNTKVYALRANATQEIGVLVRYLKGIGQDTAAVLIQDDGFGKAYASSLATASQTYGFKAATSLVFDPKTPNYPALAQALAASLPASIVLIANTQHSIGVIKALNEQKYFGQILNLAGQANGAFVKNLEGGKQIALFSAVVPSPFSNSSPAATDYRAALTKLSLNATYLSFEAYLNANVLGEVLRKTSQNNAQSLDKALANTKGLNVGGIGFDFTGNQRQGANFTDLAVLTKEGRFRH